MTSRPVYTSTAEGFRDAKEIAGFRQVRQNAPVRRKPRREPYGRSLTYFCSNKNCDHSTWAPQDQARHMFGEFLWAMEALVRYAPESPEALLLTGGIVLAELTDDELRAANSEETRLRKSGMPVGTELRLRLLEYKKRLRAGELAPVEKRARHFIRTMCGNGLHAWVPENIYVSPKGKEYCRPCRSAKSREVTRRLAKSPEWRERKNGYHRELRARKKAERAAADVG